MRRECTRDVPCHQNVPFEDLHHFYYPKADYKTKTEKQFRELPENKGYLCRCLHNFIHSTQEPPEKPTLEFMREAIRKSRGKE